MMMAEGPDAAVDEEHIRARIAELRAGPEASAASARVLFELAHTSNAMSEQNKERMGRQNAIPALCRLLRSSSLEAQYEACSALSELAFRNENNCMAIVRTPGALESLAHLLDPRNGNNQEDAALVVNNCAAFCEDAADHIVKCPKLLSSLRALAVGFDMGAKNVAVGALNCLSRSRTAAVDLMRKKVVDKTLKHVLAERGSGDKHEARLARATMAVANLTGNIPEFPGEDGAARTQQVLGTIVRILGYALDREKWAGIFFAPYSVLYPLWHLANNQNNCAKLVAADIIPPLVRVISEWSDGRHANKSLLVSLDIVQRLCDAPEHKAEMRRAGMVQALTKVCAQRRGESDACRAIAAPLLEGLLDMHLAFLMGQHSRLGGGSRIYQLDDCVVGMILEYALLGKV